MAKEQNRGSGKLEILSKAARCAIVVAVTTTALCSLPLRAEGWELGGHLKYQYSSTSYRTDDLSAVFGSNPAQDHSLDGRLKAEWRDQGLDFSVHYEALAVGGDLLATRRALADAGFLPAALASGLPNDRLRLLNLTDELADDTRFAAVQRLDRLAVGFTRGNVTLRLGRQVVSWGNGLAFQVLDFVNPFAPLAIDKSYKTGEDMVYGQWQSAGVGDAQLMFLPRRNPDTHDLDASQASTALKLHARAGEFDVDMLVARHYDQTLVGFGLVHSLGGAVWRLDTLHTDIADADDVWSLLSNIDYSWVAFGKNMYGYLEYFRNGFGHGRASDYLDADPELAARLLRGELFVLGSDYAAIGAQLEISPLLNTFATILQNLNDASRILQWRATYDWRQDTQFMLGFNLPIGERGSEFGGVATTVPGIWAAPGRTFYARAAYFF